MNLSIVVTYLRVSVLEKVRVPLAGDFWVEKEFVMQRKLICLVTVLLNALKISWNARLSGMPSNPFFR